MELIIIIIIIAFVSKSIKKANEEQAKYGNQGNATYQMPKQATRVNSAKAQVQQQNNQFQQAARENIEKAKRRSAMKQVQESREAANTTTIVDRAKKHTEEKKVDTTLETMEAEHNHSERVSAAVHHHPEDIIPENMLGSVEDLMVKGYDGNLCFERDFVGEGLDMISRFSYQ